MRDKISFYKLDFLNEVMPKVDAIIMGNIIHDWPDNIKTMLIQKAYDALEENGYLIIYDFFADNERKQTNHTFLMSLHMQLCFKGSQFTFAQAETWFKEAGFTNIKSHKLDDYQDAMVGQKKINS